MKKTISKEVTLCDECRKEEYVDECLGCGAEHCYECRKIQGVEYAHGVNISGSGDGYYCKSCDHELSTKGSNGLHNAYSTIRKLRNEQKSWSLDFKARKDCAEKTLRELCE